MKSGRLVKFGRAGLALAAILSSGSGARAAPDAYVVNADSHTVSVIDAANGNVRAHVRTWDGFSPNAGREPRDVLVDPRTGRVFVAARAKLVHFEGLVNSTSDDLTIQDEASSLALDDAGRRIFVSHEEIGNHPNGFVTVVPLSSSGWPGSPQQLEVSGIPDLRFIAWDALNRRVYVVEDDGRIARTGAGNLSFAALAGNIAPNPGGILADPAGGIWVTSRGGDGGRLVRVRENGTTTAYTIPNMKRHPRGMSWDGSGKILVAIEDENRIRRFDPASGSFADAMATDALPQDVGRSFEGTLVSANRRGSMLDGSVTINGWTAAATQQKSIALELYVPRLTPNPAAQTFCYNRTGDTDERTFSLSNTRMDGQAVTLGRLALGGSNPANYAIVADGCSSMRLGVGTSCQFRLRFTASGPSVQTGSSAFSFPSFQPPSWPAEASIASSDGAASARISLRGGLSLDPCKTLEFQRLTPTLSLGGL